ncbi:2-dehydro-3-deoxygalactonokinase [Parapedobacter indicus]|uniref:2-dehydro-3-deoxygalactonokinase n=1 Tax=Parapedobacter indicus TaxID=1477437 RepID=A0A1I3VQ92_9SPHI|nr:2-dehydro-3-deoxygalactonokinase [Parapedobacter indicus]PPL04207.1 2-dehydro-3-deoxygalactonokinase [Parapedobacter indicus]SFJ97322.1 2-dehydro-3-deoxygalactonokinase [Parapedobacter indicus]
MEVFLSCDWGTTAFRLRLVRTSDLCVLIETTRGQGIAETYNRWIDQGGSRERQAFYASILKERIAELSQHSNRSLTGVPVILSGMASSSIGMKELPYQKLPVHLDGRDLMVEKFESDGEVNPILVISGVQTATDVMRGEETKIVGCASMLADDGAEQLIILPGTHSKHAIVKQQEIIAFNTHMTGEFFKLLSTHSVLSASVEEADLDEPANQERFREGVSAARASGLLHAAFRVRTNQLLKNVSKTENFHFLSGLLIGSELKDISSSVPVYLVAGSVHNTLYKTALEELNVPIGETMDADVALIKGQYTMLSAHY